MHGAGAGSAAGPQRRRPACLRPRAAGVLSCAVMLLLTAVSLAMTVIGLPYMAAAIVPAGILLQFLRGQVRCRGHPPRMHPLLLLAASVPAGLPLHPCCSTLAPQRRCARRRRLPPPG